MKCGVIIVAGGSGTRMGMDVPKQFLLLEGRPLLVRSLESFSRSLPDADIVVVLPLSEHERWAQICREHGVTAPHNTCTGGNNRFESVKAGIGALGDVDLIAVHDGVRALVSPQVIMDAVRVASQTGSAVPVIEAVDSFRVVTGEKSAPVDRSTLRAVQTPQVFAAGVLRNAYRQEYCDTFTDDASVVEAANALCATDSATTITLSRGEQSNIKITTPLDMILAQAILVDNGSKV